MTDIENNQLKLARDVLGKILSAVPGMKLRWDPYATSDRAAVAKLVDFTVEANNDRNHTAYTLVVEFTQQGYPRQLRQAMDKLLRFHHRANALDYLVVAAPFITAEGATVCREENVGYYDLAGNCLLIFGSYYIERTGKPNPFRKSPSVIPPSLYGPRSERVLRVLLGEREKSWKVVPLAEAAHVSTGTVSIVRNVLLDREWAREGEAGLQLTRPQELLQDWAAVWGRRRERPRTYFTLRPLAEVERQMAQFARDQGRPFALTGTAGAWQRAPMTRYNRTQVYWEGDPAELANAAELKPAEAGANVQVFAPRDEGVFFQLDTVEGVPVVSAWQLYLDLQRDRARGEEAAEHLWRTVLFPGNERPL
jgi:hypothetical protein